MESGDRPAENEREIEVTPEMIEAGVVAAWPEPKPPEIVRRLVENIYRAMEEVKKVGVSRSGSPT